MKHRFIKYAAPPLILIFILCLFSFAAGGIRITKATIQGNLIKILNAIDTELDANRTLTNALRAQAVSNDYVFSDPNIAVYTSTGTDEIQTDNLYWVINGCLYYKASAAIDLNGAAIPPSLYGAWALEVGADGTIDVVPATGNDSGYEGYASAALAVAGLPAVAANHARLGYVTVTKATTFHPGSTGIGTATVVYTDYTAASNIGAAITEQVNRGK